MPQTSRCHISKKIAFLAFLAIFATNASAACDAEANWNTICPGSFPDGVNWNSFPTTQVDNNPYIEAGCYYVTDIEGAPNFSNKTDKKINGTNLNFDWSGDIPSKIDEGYYIYVITAQNVYGASYIVPGNIKPACADATPPLEGTVNIDNTSPRIGDVLTASIESDAIGPFSYEWTAGDAAVGSNSDSYTVTLNDLGKTIKVEISADDRKGSLPSAATAAVVKKSPPSAPSSPPSLESKTHNTVTLNSTVGYEYSKDGTTWQSNSKFTNLDPNTPYTFFQRIGETTDTQASAASAGFPVTTDNLNPNALLGTATISGPNPPQISDVLTAGFAPTDPNDVVGDLTYTWSANGSEIGTGQTYTVQPQDFGKTITVAVTASIKNVGEIESAPTAAIVKIPNTTPPSALTSSDIAETTVNSIIINGSNAYEYGYSVGCGFDPDFCGGGSPTVIPGVSGVNNRPTVGQCVFVTGITRLVPASGGGQIYVNTISSGTATCSTASQNCTAAPNVDKKDGGYYVYVKSGSLSSQDSWTITAPNSLPSCLNNNNPGGDIIWLGNGVYTITGLSAGTDYNIYRRSVATATHTASTESGALSVRTETAPTPYWITGQNNGPDNFGARTGSATGTLLGNNGENGNFKDKLQFIKDLAGSNNVSITYGNGNDVLAIRANSSHLPMVFESWTGKITLAGKIRMEGNTELPFIQVGSGAILTSNVAEVGTSGGTFGSFIRVAGSGSATVASGTIAKGTNRGIIIEDQNSTGTIAITGGTFTGTGDAIYNQSPTASIILGGTPNITGAIRTPINTITALPGFSPPTAVTLQFDPIAAGVAVTNGANLLNKFTTSAAGYELKPINEHLYLCGTTAFSGSISIDNTSPRIGETLTPVNNTGASVLLSYVWKAAGVQVGTGATYTVQQADHNKTITVEMTSCDRSGMIASAATDPVKGTLNEFVPEAPTEEEITAVTVTLVAIPGYEYRVNNGAWQDSPVFEDLTADTPYSFYQRVKASGYVDASQSSPALEVATLDDGGNGMNGVPVISGPNPPKIDDVLTATLTENASAGELTLTYTWKADDVSIQTGAGNTYTVESQDVGKTITVTISALEKVGSVTSVPTAAVVKKPASTTPTVLASGDITGTTTSSITIAGDNTYDYGYKKAGTNDDIIWLANGTYTISGLSQGTEYLVYRRFKETNIDLASDASGPLAVTTVETPPVAYWITGGADNFGARTGSASGSFIAGSNDQNNQIPKSITDIKTHAGINNVSITYYGNNNGNDALQIREGQLPMIFESWSGKITLGGKISVPNATNNPFIQVRSGAILTSNIAEVNLANPSVSAFISVQGSGSATIASGTINKGANKGVTIENNSTGSITITGGTFSGSGLAVENLSPDAKIYLGGTPSITGAIKTQVNTITALSNFNPATTVQLQFDSPVAGEVAVTDGAALAGSFSLTGTNGYALSPINNNIYLCATTGTAITGTAAISNTSPRFGDVLTASISGTNAGNLRSYVWKANDVQVGIGQTYTVQAGDYNKTITVTISSCDKIGTVSSAATDAVKKMANSHITVLPETESVTYNVITLSAINGYEYSKDGTAWQDSPVFSGLIPGTQYNIYQRQKETADTEASQTSEALPVTTENASDDILLGAVTIAVSGELRVGTVLTAEFAGTNEEAATDIEYEWKANGVQVGTAGTYTVTLNDLGKQITVTVTAGNKTGDISSIPTATVQKAILTGTATISFNGDAPQVGTSATLTASIAGGNNTGVHSYVWKANGVQVGTAGTYTVTTDDVGRRITVTISTADQEGSVTSEPTPAVRGTNGIAAISYFLINNNADGDGGWSAHKGTYNSPAVAGSSGNVQTAIEAVRADAVGADVIMNFGGTGSSRFIHKEITFSNAGPQVWGEITLQGELIMRGSFTVITIESGVSVISSLDFEHGTWGTESTPFTNRGTLTIIDGILVKNNAYNNDKSIINTGTLILSGNPTLVGRIETTVGGLGVNNLTGSNTYELNFTNAANSAIAVRNGSDFGSRFSVVNSNYSLIPGGINLLLRSGNTTPTCDADFTWDGSKCMGVFSGTVSIAGNIAEPRIGDELTASYTGSIAPAKLRYTWKRYDASNNPTTIANATAATYTLTVNDVGYKIAVEISADGFNGSAGSEETGVVAKQVYVGQVIEPVLFEVTPSSITLVGISGYEYRLSDGTWQSSPEFTGLEYNREYEFYQRVAETATTEASSEAGPVAVKTTKTLLDGTATITGNIGDTRVGDELTAQLIGGNTDELEYQWKANGENIADANNSTYTVTAGDHGKQITVVISAAEESGYEGSEESEPTAAVKWPNIFGDAVIASSGDLDDPRVGDELTASLNNGPSSGLAYVWKRNGEATGEATNEYTLAVADIGTIISVEISASNYYGSVSASLDKEVEKKVGPATPAAPTFAEKTNTSITLAAINGGEYTIDNGASWQTETLFEGLSPNTEYTFVQRIAETEDTYASETSVSATYTTDRNAAPATPDAPMLASKTNTTITLNAIGGGEYSIDNGTNWQLETLFEGLSPNTEYTFVQRIAETEDTYASETSTSATYTTDRNAAPATPDAPMLASKTNTTITLNAIGGGEYSKDNGANWQSETLFEGLSPNTEYTFVQRIAETEDTYASETSAPATYTTDRNEAPPTPNAPTFAGKTNTSITLAAINGGEYSIDNGANWQSETLFTGLDPNETYTFVQRIAQTQTTYASETSESATYTTDREAAPGTPDAPELAGKTSSTITLVAIEGGEYSKDGTTWQSSNVFSDLNPNTEYSFVQRIAETSTTYASETSDPATYATDRNAAPATPEVPTLAGKTSSTITLAAIEGGEYSIDGGTNWQSETLFADLDPNEDYTFVQRVAQTQTTFASETSDPATYTTDRNAAPPPPAKPTFAGKTSSTITLAAIEGGEYSIDGGTNWQSETLFEGLDPNETYTFVQRIAQTLTTHASETSAEATYLTDKNTVPAPDAPQLASKENNSVTLVAVEGYEYSIDGGTTWQSSNVFSGLSAHTTYFFVQRIAQTQTTYASDKSAALEETTHKNTVPAPNAPTLVGNATYNSVTLVATTGYEYSKDNGATWQSSNEFDDLNPNATYTFVQRIAETEDTYASEQSDALHITTEKALIPGIATISGASDPRVGQTLTAFLDGGSTEGLTYEWKKYTGHSFVKAVGSSATYTLIEDDVGHEFEVVISGPNYSNYSESDKTQTVRHPDLAGSITITGNPIIGQQLGVHLVTNAVADHVYSWKIGDDEVGTDAAYTVAEDDHGQQITVTVSAAHEHQPGELTSATTSAVAYPALAGNITISGEARLGETLTADATGLQDNYGELIYAWKKDGQIIGSEDTYELTVGDADYAITLTVSTDKQSTGIESAPTSVVLRKVNTNTTVAAQENEVTHNSIILAEIPEYEYKISGQAWQTSPEFTNLTANTDYTFCQREAQNDEFEASEESCELTVKTLPKKDAPEAPAVPTIASKTHNSVTLVAVEGYEYSKDNGASWQSENVFGDLTPDTEYSFVQRIAETENSYASEASLELTATTESLPTPIGKPNFANTNIGISVSGGNLHVYTPKSVQVRIFDLKGKELLNRTIAPNEIVSITHLPKGMYMVNVGKETFKLVK